jgi:hypothetical protein
MRLIMNSAACSNAAAVGCSTSKVRDEREKLGNAFGRRRLVARAIVQPLRRDAGVDFNLQMPRREGIGCGDVWKVRSGVHRR